MLGTKYLTEVTDSFQELLVLDNYPPYWGVFLLMSLFLSLMSNPSLDASVPEFDGTYSLHPLFTVAVIGAIALAPTMLVPIIGYKFYKSILK